MDVTTWTRHSLFLLIALLALLGNTPQHVANAQQGTTAKRTTLRKTTAFAPGGGGGGANAATTIVAIVQKTTLVAGANQGPTTNGPGSANASPRQTQPSNGQATTIRSNVGGGGGSVLTSAPGGGSNNGVITTKRPSGIVTSRVSQASSTSSTTDSKNASTTQETSPTTTTSATTTTTTTTTTTVTTPTTSVAAVGTLSTASSQTNAAQTTRFAIATSPTPDPTKVMFDYEYRLSESSNAIIGFESICASNSKNDFAARLNINTVQIVSVKCEGTSNQDVLVQGSITGGPTPTVQEMENFKTTTEISTLYFKGARGSSVALVRGSFKYSKREQSEASSSEERRILGLTETHWVLIGMGTVILILFSISLGVVLTHRRFAPQEKLDEESSSTGADSDTEEKPKKKWFGFMKGKKKGESDSESDEGNDSDSASDGSSTDGSERSEEEEEKKKKKKGFGLFKKKDKKGDDSSVSTRTDAESAYESTKDGDDYDELPNDQSSNIPEEHKIV